MNRMEKEMAARETSAREALKTLAALDGPASKAPLADAAAALDRFEKLSSELVALSRRNTNVRSLSLSLKQKPALTAACDASLVALEEALAKRGFGATR
jgi:ABC-type multidrug transport system ATPase subunit